MYEFHSFSTFERSGDSDFDSLYFAFESDLEQPESRIESFKKYMIGRKRIIEFRIVNMKAIFFEKCETFKKSVHDCFEDFKQIIKYMFRKLVTLEDYILTI